MDQSRLEKGPRGSVMCGRRSFIAPIRGDMLENAKHLVAGRLFAFSTRTMGQLKINDGDQLCFYVGKVGIIGWAEAGKPPRHIESDFMLPGFTEYVGLTSAHMFLEPRPLTTEIRSRLIAFKNHDPVKRWSWFVQSAHEVDPGDFLLLVGQADS